MACSSLLGRFNALVPQQLRQLGYVRCDASRLVAHGTSPFRSQTWFSFFNGRYASPAALPITASFFFESETAGLMFVRHRWPQSFRWWLFCRFPREDAAADYECAHDCPENPKWHLLHCGVLHRSTPLRAIIRRSAIKSCAIAPATWRYLPQSAAFVIIALAPGGLPGVPQP
jgi:hypothetical protein